MDEAFSQTNFSTIDWAIVVVYLAISLVIGIYVRRYIHDMADYIGAGRAVGTGLGIATMTGTELGLITVMYMAQKGFTGGFAAFHMALIAGVVTFIVGVTGFIVSKLRALKVLTIPEFYELRFDRKTRLLGGVMLAFGGILNMGLFLKVGSMFIVGVTGMSPDGSALKMVMITLLTLVLIYTVLGGMISVVITDYIQFVVLSLGIFIAVGLAILNLGWSNLFTTIQAEMGPSGMNPFASEGKFGADYVLWMAFLGLIGCTVWPTAVARALAMESPEAVKRQFRWSSLSFAVRFMVPQFLGICAFVFIVTKAPDLKALFMGDNPEVNNLYAMPVFLGRILPVGLIGIITAAMIAAFMSTHDSYLLCWSSVITQDIVAPLKRNFTAKQRITLTRVLIVAIGGFLLWWGLFYEGGDDIWDYMAVTGAIYFVGAFAVLTAGLYWKRASSTGAFLTLLSGIFAICGLDPVRKRIGLTDWSSEQIGLTVVALAIIVMICGSLLFPDKPKTDVAK